MFIVFIAQIVARYLFRNPLPWAYEVTVTCYLWMVVLSACYAQRERSHVAFTLVYDKLPIKGKAVCSFLGHLIIAVAFVVSVVPSYNFIVFMKMQQTTILQVGLNIVYAPYMIMLILILGYVGDDLVVELMVFTGSGGQKAIDLRRKQTKNETQEAIDAVKEAEQLAQETEGVE